MDKMLIFVTINKCIKTGQKDVSRPTHFDRIVTCGIVLPQASHNMGSHKVDNKIDFRISFRFFKHI